ncbi:MAG: hypothetical protein AAF657_05835 [Acidobacteriota bacterium]
MSSSTSSSDAPPPAAPEASGRKIYLRILLLITLGMGLCMSIFRVFAHLNDVGSDTLLARVQEARAALPRIVAESDDLVMAFGSSMTEAGFSARQFDRQLRGQGLEVKSFNFGFGGLNPYFQDYLSRRIREAFVAGDRRLELALIEFVPFQVTTRRFDGARPVIDSFLTLLASPEEIWQITREDPQRGILMANIRYVRDAISAEMTTFHFGSFLRPADPRSSLPEDEELTARRRQLSEQFNARFDEDYPDYEDAEWHYGWQGAGTIPEERSQATRDMLAEIYETLRTARLLEDDRLRRITCCDIEELHFEEVLVESFIRMVQNFQQFSNHVEVILLPRNTEWIHYPPEAVERMQVVLDRIRSETGVTIRDYQVLEGFSAKMFSDTTHLSRYEGDVAFTAHLVEEYTPLLAESLR